MSDERDDERDDRARDDPERDRQIDTDREADADGPDARRDRNEPLADLAEEVRERTDERARDDGSRSGRLPEGERRSERPEESQREGPLADVAAAVDERRSRKRDDADAFESVEVGDIDGERLWEQLAAEEEGPTVAASPEQTADATASADATDGIADPTAQLADATDRDVRTIPKATCHGCPHFGDPPELHCTHEGTDILAMTDADHFRVADCPIVVDGEEDIGSITGGNDGDGES